MKKGFVELWDTDSLDRFLAQSNDGPVLILKHSETCGVSSRAYAEMAKVKHPVGLIIVQKARAVSDDIERRWQVSHETPQVLIVRDGKVVWEASHFRVKADAVEAALSEVSGKPLYQSEGSAKAEGKRQKAVGSRQ